MTHRSGRAPAEHDAIRRLTDWLAQRFPDLSVDDVERAVYGNHSSVEDRTIRDFVPVLIDQANRRLDSRPPTRHGTGDAIPGS